MGTSSLQDTAEAFDRGHGKFYDIDRDHPEKMVVHQVELRRADDKEITTMNAGAGKDQRSLVVRKVREG